MDTGHIAAVIIKYAVRLPSNRLFYCITRQPQQYARYRHNFADLPVCTSPPRQYRYRVGIHCLLLMKLVPLATVAW